MYLASLRLLLFSSCLLLNSLRLANSYLRNEGARAARAVRAVAGVGSTWPQAESRVVGGEAAGRALPWFALLHPAGTPPSNAVCGGTLVTLRHVVTAAHCLPVLQQPAVTLGALNRCRVSESGRREMAVASAVPHPNFSVESEGGTGLNDIAVLTLTQPAIGFQVAALPRTASQSLLTEIFPGGGDGVSFEPAAAGRAALVAGFGERRQDDRRSQPCHLQVASVRVLSREQCVRSRVPNKYALEPTLLCAGLRSGGVDTCAGSCLSAMAVETVRPRDCIHAWLPSCRGSGSNWETPLASPSATPPPTRDLKQPRTDHHHPGEDTSGSPLIDGMRGSIQGSDASWRNILMALVKLSYTSSAVRVPESDSFLNIFQRGRVLYTYSQKTFREYHIYVYDSNLNRTSVKCSD